MKTAVWFDDVDGRFETLKFENPGDALAIRIPHMGSKVGIWQTKEMKEMEGNHYALHYVVDVRHYVVQQGSKWLQEIHVLCSSDYRPLSTRRTQTRERITLPDGLR